MQDQRAGLNFRRSTATADVADTVVSHVTFLCRRLIDKLTRSEPKGDALSC